MTIIHNNVYVYAGALIRLTDGGSTNFQSTNVGSSFNDYQGYAVVGGNFLTAARQGIILPNTKIRLY